MNPEIKGENLKIETCPHCGVNKPHCVQKVPPTPIDSPIIGKGYFFAIYMCTGCSLPIMAIATNNSYAVCYPSPQNSLDESIPERARNYLSQALQSKSSPDACVMVCASSVDAMLKGKGYKDGSLYNRIDKATENHLITQDMATWAHAVRLEANGSRHADETEDMKTDEDAKDAIAFTKALAEYLFVLPARVNKGMERKD